MAIASSISLALLVEVVLFVRLDGAVARRVRDAGKHEALTHLIVIEEGLIRLVNLACGDDARAGRAGARAAGVREVDASLLRCSYASHRMPRATKGERMGLGVGGRLIWLFLVAFSTQVHGIFASARDTTRAEQRVAIIRYPDPGGKDERGEAGTCVWIGVTVWERCRV